MYDEAFHLVELVLAFLNRLSGGDHKLLIGFIGETPS
jgi:TM2 domain-containing membrane protein YozV